MAWKYSLHIKGKYMSKKKSMERRERQMTLNIEKKNSEKNNIELERPLGKYEFINPKTSGKKRSFFS